LTGAVAAQAHSVPTIKTRQTQESACMTWIVLEALGALLLLVFIVWWTMFSGRPKGELPKDGE